jgi:tRNA-uridine 2-sulfurtransferase
MPHGAHPNWLPSQPKRIAVAMSGGVDSSAVAYMLAEAGHEIIGLTAWTLNGPGKCCNEALVNAGRVCEALGCDFDTVDLRAEFSHYVLDYYNRSYQQGLTPNPCVECNRYVKWEALVAYAVNELGVDYVATGHYINLHRPDGEHGTPRVLRALDEYKDQTYMLARVLRPDIARALFPLGGWRKADVVAYAASRGVPTAHSKESMDVCFVLNGQANYLKQTLGVTPGPIVDCETGAVVGQHEGHYLFTRGQRKGVGVAAGRPVYVVRTDAATNTVFIGDAHHLEATTMRVCNVHWLRDGLGHWPQQPLRSAVKFRYNTPAQLATLTPCPKQPATDVLVTFDNPQLAITNAQIAAFYDDTDTELWGGGFIGQWLAHQAFDPTAERTLPDLHCQV